MERHIQNVFPNYEGEKNKPGCIVDFTNHSSDKDPERGGILLCSRWEEANDHKIAKQISGYIQFPIPYTSLVLDRDP